ncbi:MAG: hypothetical protein M5U18_08410 [Dehalococcoidia bacterium]|nr:hypothetical protein [Dehalococcoidia bacterium]
MTGEDRKKLYQEMLRKSYDESSRALTLTTPVFYGLSDKAQGVTPMREAGLTRSSLPFGRP